MSHDSTKSPSIGMISTATLTTATVTPLDPLANGSAASQAANSGFAAALRHLAKRGETFSREPSPASSPSTCHGSPTTPPKWPAVGTPPTRSQGRSVPRTPPVVTIAPTKISDSVWRNETRKIEAGERSESTCLEEKRSPPLSCPRARSQLFGPQCSSVMQDPRIRSLSLQGQLHPRGTPGEEYLRALRPFATSNDLRLTSAPIGLDPSAAHNTAAAYYPPAYLPHPLSLQRVEESLCLSALRGPFYSLPGGGTFSSLLPSALHLHMPASHYPAEQCPSERCPSERCPSERCPSERCPSERSHPALAERLQMESELHQRERERERQRERERGQQQERERECQRERERECQRARERERQHERERERQRERERERQRERERERQREREREEADRLTERHRDRLQQMVRGAESHYLAELQAHRAPLEDGPRPGHRTTPNRPDKAQECERGSFSKTSSRGSVLHAVSSLVPSLLGKHHSMLAAAMLTQTMNEDVWLTRRPGRDGERSGPAPEAWRDNHRLRLRVSDSVPVNSHWKDGPTSLGTPPPLISPKGPPVTATPLWNPASFVDCPPARGLTNSTLPCHPPPGLTRTDRATSDWWDRADDSRRRAEGFERSPLTPRAAVHDAASGAKAETDVTTQSGYPRWGTGVFQQRASMSTPLSRAGVGCSPSQARGRSLVPHCALVYDEVLQQHKRLLSKLDLEERRRKEAKDGGYFFDMDESFDESDKEEVRAHLRRVTEQPPLKLDTCSEKVAFLNTCGLITRAKWDQLLVQKRRKRRRMLKERSPSPPAPEGNKRTCPALSTPFSAEQMDRTPELCRKKDFLSTLSLSHVSRAQRRVRRRTEELLKAIKRRTVTLDSLRYLSTPPSPPPLNGASTSPSLTNGHSLPDSPSPSPPSMHKPNNEAQRSSQAPQLPQALRNKRSDLVQPGWDLQKTLPRSGQNGRSHPWDRFSPEVFAQHFHQAVLQSTRTRDGPLIRPSKVSPPRDPAPHCPQLLPPHRDSPSGLDLDLDLEEEAEDEEAEDEEAVEVAERKWQGIESVLEEYQQYAEECWTERQVLQSQSQECEAQSVLLRGTVEQLSRTMRDLMGQRQRLHQDSDRLQDQLDDFRRCLTLPDLPWSRGRVNGHMPRTECCVERQKFEAQSLLLHGTVEPLSQTMRVSRPQSLEFESELPVTPSGRGAPIKC